MRVPGFGQRLTEGVEEGFTEKEQSQARGGGCMSQGIPVEKGRVQAGRVPWLTWCLRGCGEDRLCILGPKFQARIWPTQIGVRCLTHKVRSRDSGTPCQHLQNCHQVMQETSVSRLLMPLWLPWQPPSPLPLSSIYNCFSALNNRVSLDISKALLPGGCRMLSSIVRVIAVSSPLLGGLWAWLGSCRSGLRMRVE